MHPQGNKILRRLAACVAISVGTSTAVLGCASRPDLVRTKAVAVESVSSQHAAVSKVDVAKIGSKLRIYGELRRLPLASRTVPGHVRIELVDAEGKVVTRISESYRRKDKRYRHLWFLTELDSVPPAGSRIRVTHIPPSQGGTGGG